MTAAPGMTAEPEAQQGSQLDDRSAPAEIVVCLGPAYTDATPEHLAPLLAELEAAFATRAGQVLVSWPSQVPEEPPQPYGGLRIRTYHPAATVQTVSVETALTFVHAYELVRAHNAQCCVLLGAEAHTLGARAVATLAEAVTDHHCDLAMPRYCVRANELLLNSAILSPLSRALFGSKVRFPLALDMALSARMAERLAEVAQRFTAAGDYDALLWPTAEAAVAGYSVAEVETGPRELPRPAGADLPTVLTTVASSLFSEVEAKATYWQRTRPVLPTQRFSAAPPPEPQPRTGLVEPAELEESLRSFRLAYGNLHEIWSLVLPPNTLLGLKRMSVMPMETFRMPDALWVRIIYDFALAHRLRTINRGHLLGALTPLYLAWVASHILLLESGDSSDSIESLARAFEADKPYLVSRWRWPDRFNP